MMMIGASGSNSLVKDSVIFDNHSDDGGSIALLISELTIENTEFYGNTSSSVAPTIIMNMATITINDCTFRNSKGTEGVHVYAVT